MADQRAIRTELSDSTYARIVDVPRALEARRYATDLDVVVGVTDRLLPKNDGQFPDRGDGRRARRGSAAAGASPIWSWTSASWAAIYLGGVSLRTLHGAGLVRERDRRLGGGDDPGLRVGPAAVLPGPLLVSEER